MAAISKQALIVENNQSFPNNNAGEITPSALRSYNVDVIDSTVNQTAYNVDSSSWNNSISVLSAFTQSQQPSFNALNAFTASQLVINSGVNAFTWSADARLDAVENDTNNIEAWTASVNQISDDGIVQGYSTRLHFYGLVSASIVPNINGPIAAITIQQDGTKAETGSFNAFTASTNQQLDSLEEWSGSAKNSIEALSNYTQSVGPAATGSLVVTSSFSVDRITFTKGNNTTYVNVGIQSTASFNTYTGSQDTKNTTLASLTSSILAFTGSENTKNTTLSNVTSSLIARTGSYATTGSNTFTGSQIITGSVLGNVTALTIASNTASMNLAVGNFFTLTLVSGSTTSLALSNVGRGQTVNLLVTQAASGTGSLLLPGIRQPQNNAYTASFTSSGRDIITFVTFDSTASVYATSVKNLV